MESTGVKYCITGGSGFIGSYFCDLLKARGDEIVILDLVEPPASTPHDRYVSGDVRDPAAVRDALAGCDRVLHLAAAHHDFGIEDETYFSVNEGSAKVLGDEMDHAGVRYICYYSTVAMYGTAPLPHNEETEPQCNSPYGASKQAGEKVLEAWANRGDGRSALIIRPTVTFGPRNFANMYSLIRQIDGGKFFFAGRASNIKSLSYIENIVDATLFLLDKDGRDAFDVYNYVEKPDLTSREIAVCVYEALGKKPPSWTMPFPLARLLTLPFDIVIALTGKNIPVSSARLIKLFVTQTLFEADKVRTAGFEPRVSLEDGIQRMVRWYLDGGKDQSAEWHLPPKEIRFSDQDQS